MKHLYKFSLLLLALLLPATAIAHDFEVDGIYYNINGNEATVTYKGTYSSQYSNEYSGDVTIPTTVTYGGTSYSVTSIGDYAFSNCTGLTSVIIPNSVTTIGSSAFYGCRGLSTIIIPCSVTSIGSSAFYNCNELTSIDIPNSVTTIGNRAFSGCSGLTSIIVASGNPNYDSRNNCNAIIETATNTLIAGCMNTVIGNFVTSISEGAFSSCTGLTSIDIPNSVTSIGRSAFYNCSGLTSIDIPNSVTSIGEWTFYECTGLTSITIPNSVIEIGYNAFAHCRGLTNINVASDNSTYDSRNNCNALIESASNTLILGCQNTVIPNSVTIIGDGAFADCCDLTSIEIPNSVTSIGSSAFQGCTSLTSIDIPNSVTIIGGYAFDECSSLTSITIPNSVTTIGECALEFTAWYNNQPDGLVYAGLIAYRYKGTMPDGMSITLKNGTHSIADHVFYGCTGLSSITIPNTVNSIGYGAFSGCSSLTSIDIPNSVTSIGEAAFISCENLNSINIGNSVASIGDYAFLYCSRLTNIVIASDNSIYDSRNYCNAIIETASNTLILGCMNTVIPNTITSIGYMAFSSSYITEIYSLALVPPTIDPIAFDCWATLFVPDIALEAYKAADYWNNSFINIVGMPYTFEVDGTSYHATTMNTASVMANNDGGILYNGDVVIPDSVTYAGQTFAVTGIEDNAFDGCFELTSVTIPNSVETIGEQAFQGCTGLTSVTIGSGVTAIGAKAFNYCNALETVKCLGTVPPVMASADCFSTAAYNRATLLVPRQQIEAYQAADYWYKFAHIDGWGSAGRGDIDGDGVVSIRDVTRMIDAILNGDNEGIYVESADLNLNGRLDIGDVTTIIDMLLNGN